MTKARIWTAMLCALCTASGGLHAADAFQDQKHFEAAVLNESSAPSFVLITIIDDRTGKSWTGCTLADFIKGAIAIENSGSVGGVPEEKLNSLMLSNKTHIFHFSKKAALDNTAMARYRPEELQQARDYLEAFHDEWMRPPEVGMPGLKTRLKLNQGALACAIIEKGYSAILADMVGAVYAEQ